MYTTDGDKIILDKDPKKLTDVERLEIATSISEYITEFPYYRVTNEEIYAITKRLDELAPHKTETAGNIYQNQVGIKLINSFHPHMWSVKCQNFKTPQEIFADKKKFIRAIDKYIGTMDKRVITYTSRIVILKTSSGAQAVSNFRPSVAKYIYSKYGNGGSVLDPCIGYGGRLFGAWCSNIKRYVGVDPCTPTIEGNKNLIAKLKENDLSNTKRFGAVDRPEIVMHQSPFEDFNTDEKFDLVFTSPPYFGTEKYSDEETQSWKRYAEKDAWLNNFLKVLIQKAYDYLKSDGYMVLNVSPAMQEDTIRLANEIFKSEPQIESMVLSLLPVRANQEDRENKVEPAIVYRKSGLTEIKSATKQVKFI